MKAEFQNFSGASAPIPRNETPPRDEAAPRDNPDYLSRQLITYLGNKRALLDFIGRGVSMVKARLGKDKLDCLDAFSGSGAVARYLKGHSRLLVANDLERYSEVINSCYLANRSELDMGGLRELHRQLVRRLGSEPLEPGFISRLYAPADDSDIKPGERAFYTSRNAAYLDSACRLIGALPPGSRPFFLAPLLSEASIHANTSGVFKGFHKDAATGLGKFGGRKGDALSRIRGDIELPFPLFSDFECECRILRQDAVEAAGSLPELDLAYLDPPYNQHPYGSNYFMLNLIADYREPGEKSRVSGIPSGWNRSPYNKGRLAAAALGSLVGALKAKFILVSYNSEGFVDRGSMLRILSGAGKVEVLETRYNAFRGSRNLGGRDLHLSEYLYLVEKR
jgi:adenine-specific DNA-methyltransferase